MTTKRTRIFRSSSMGEVQLLDTIKPVESRIAPWEKKRATGTEANAGTKSIRIQGNDVKSVQKPVIKDSKVFVEMPPRKSIFTCGSPVREKKDDSGEAQVDKRYGMFLKACYLCKKRIHESAEVFMYGYLQAFCSRECREDQIAMDKRFRTPSPEPFKAMHKLTAKPGFETQVPRLEISRFK